MTTWVSAPRARTAAGVAVLYLLVALLIGSGVASHPGSRLLGDETSDAAGVARGLWVAQQEHETPFTLWRDSFDGAPEGVPQAPAVNLVEPLQPAGVWSLSGLVGRVAAVNLFMLLAVAASALSVFLLAAHVLRLRLLASVVAGYAAALSPWMVEQALAGHLAFLFVAPLVALIAALARVDAQRTLAAAVLVGLAFGAAFLTAAYVGMLAAAIAVGGVIVILARTRGAADRLWVGTLACVAVAAAVAVLVPGLVAYALHHATTARIAGHGASGGEAIGVWPQQYLNPGPYLRVLGPLHVGGRSLAFGSAESVVFFGYTTLVLAIAALWLYRRGRLQLATATARSVFWIAAAAAVVAFLLSMPPHLTVGGVRLPLPSAALGAVTSYYRIYARFGVVVALAACILAAFTLDAAWRRDRRLGTALALLVVVELLPASLPTLGLGARPIDRWLSAHGGGIVAPYPQPTDSQEAVRFALDNQALQPSNGHPLYTLLSGGTGGTREAAIRILTRYPDATVTPGILAAEHVRYVLVDAAVYRASGAAPPTLPANAFRQVATVGATRVYELAPGVRPADLPSLLEQNAASIALVEGLPAPAVAYHGFGPPAPDGWRSATDGATVTLSTTDADLRRAQLYFDLRTRGGSATVTFTDPSGASVASASLSPTTTRIGVGPLPVSAAPTAYTVHVSPGAAVELRTAIVQPLADFSVSLAAG